MAFDIAKILASEEDHQVVEQRTANLRDDGIVEVIRDVDTPDLRADAPGNRLNRNMLV